MYLSMLSVLTGSSHISFISLHYTADRIRMLMHLKVFPRSLKGNAVTITSIACHIRLIRFHNTKNNGC